MTRRRPVILVGMAAGLIWGLGLLWLGPALWQGPDTLALALAVFPPGIVLLAMIARLAQRRFFDDAIVDGQPFPPDSAAAIDQKVLTNTVEQIVLAVCVWPLATLVHGPGVAVALGAGFSLARMAFWFGYHVSPPLRSFGFAATFYPTILAALWAVAGLLA